jgi:hypothetical protein
MGLSLHKVIALAGVAGLLAAGQGARADALQDLAAAAGKNVCGCLLAAAAA